MAQADVQSLWLPPKLLSAARVASKDVEIAESMVIDHLLGWRSIVSTYEAIFAFDLTDAMRRIEAPTLVLEMQTAGEAHLGAQRARALRDDEARACRSAAGLPMRACFGSARRHRRRGNAFLAAR
jgi:hypothetical protein